MTHKDLFDALKPGTAPLPPLPDDDQPLSDRMRHMEQQIIRLEIQIHALKLLIWGTALLTAPATIASIQNFFR